MADVQAAEYFWWLLMGIQVLGILSPSLTRNSFGRSHQTFCQFLFFFVFVCVAACTVGFLATGAHSWVFSGFILGWMAIAATWDPGETATQPVR